MSTSLTALTIITLVILTPLAVVTAFFALELFVGIVPSKAGRPADDTLASAVVVIPAHNEGSLIARTVATLLAHSADRYSILVIADNCSDQTAVFARTAGARVLERNDANLRGKGFALAAARDDLRKDPPEVVIVLDADCQIDRPSLDSLVEAASAGRPCQAINLLAPDLRASPLVQISTFAFMIKNLFRQRGLQRLAQRAHLTGTGMALPWSLFSDVNLGGANIVEDLALGLELSSRALGPVLVTGATVWSPAASSAGTLVQRNRWEGGYLATALKLAPAAFVRSLLRGDFRGLCAALDLSIPPVALLLLLDVAGLLIGLALVIGGGASWPLSMLASTGISAAIAIFLAWAIEGRKFASLSALVKVPFYVVWKLPMYAKLVRRGAPKEWLRTGRP